MKHTIKAFLEPSRLNVLGAYTQKFAGRGILLAILAALTIPLTTNAQSTPAANKYKPPASAVASWALQSPNQPGGTVAWVKGDGKNAWYVDAPVAPGDTVSSYDSLSYNISGLGSTLFTSFSLTEANETGSPDTSYEAVLSVTNVGPQGYPQTTYIESPFAKGHYDSAVTSGAWTTYTWSTTALGFPQGKSVTGISMLIEQRSPNAQYDTSFYFTNPKVNGYVIPQALNVVSAP